MREGAREGRGVRDGERVRDRARERARREGGGGRDLYREKASEEGSKEGSGGARRGAREREIEVLRNRREERESCRFNSSIVNRKTQKIDLGVYVEVRGGKDEGNR